MFCEAEIPSWTKKQNFQDFDLYMYLRIKKDKLFFWSNNPSAGIIP